MHEGALQQGRRPTMRVVHSMLLFCAGKRKGGSSMQRKIADMIAPLLPGSSKSPRGVSPTPPAVDLASYPKAAQASAGPSKGASPQPHHQGMVLKPSTSVDSPMLHAGIPAVREADMFGRSSALSASEAAAAAAALVGSMPTPFEHGLRWVGRWVGACCASPHCRAGRICLRKSRTP
jgi:hypothetical protein